MPYIGLAFLSVTLFALVHIYAYHLNKLSKHTQSWILSIGQGVAIAFVFLDLLPKLCKNDAIMSASFKGFMPYFERHVYVAALLGFMLFFFVARMREKNGSEKYWLSLASYAFFNFLIGYAVVDKNNPEVKPLLLFTIAIGLHYFANDYSLNKAYHKEYAKSGKWIMVACLYVGWLLGALATISTVAIALVSAFIGGGIILNVMLHELPKENPRNLKAFFLAAIAYAILLLSIG